MTKRKTEDKGVTDWNTVLTSLNTGQSDERFYFPRETRNRVRLVQSPKDEFPYQEITTYWQGEPKVKYMVLGWVPDLEELRGVILTLTAFRSLVALLADGWELFDPDEGYGITILKDKQGKRISYSVNPSKSPMPLDRDVAEELEELSLEDYITEWDAFQKRQNESYLAERKGSSQAAQTSGSDWD